VAGEAAARLTPETCADFPASRFLRSSACATASFMITATWISRSSETVQTHLPLLFEELQRFFVERGEA
jgi:hypothetical protein